MQLISVSKFGVDFLRDITVLKIMKVFCLTVGYIMDVYVQGSQSCLVLCSTENNKHFLGVINLDHFSCVVE